MKSDRMGKNRKGGTTMEKKLFHPSIHVARVEEIDPEMLELAMVFLHTLGWFTQQGSFENAVSTLKFLHDKMPEEFIKACATGFAAIHHMLE